MPIAKSRTSLTANAANTQVLFDNLGQIFGASGFTYNAGTGGVAIAAPISGAAFTITALAGALGISLSAGPIFNSNVAKPSVVMDSSGANFGIIQNNSTGIWALAFGSSSLVNGTSVLTWSATGDLVGRGVAFCKRATAVEQATSTTTLVNSTQLTYAIPGAGTYAFELVVFSYFTTAVTDGITANVNYSGTFTAVGSYVTGLLMNGTTTTLGIQPVEISATVNNALAGMTLATYGASVSSATPACHILKGNLIATGAGTLAFAFAEAVNGIDSANLGVGSYMTVTQLS